MTEDFAQKQFATPLGATILADDRFDEILGHNPTEKGWSETGHYLFYSTKTGNTDSTLTTTAISGYYTKRNGVIVQHIFDKELWSKDKAWNYLKELAEKVFELAEKMYFEKVLFEDMANPAKLSEASKEDLIEDHNRLHRLAKEWEEGQHRDKFSWGDLIQWHGFVMAELGKSGIKCEFDDKLARASEELAEIQKEYDLDQPVRQAFGSPGGKKYLAPLIVSLIPEHKIYVEPFAGGAAVFFKKPKSVSEVEVLGDLDENIVKSYRFLQNCSTEDIEALTKRNWGVSKHNWERVRAFQPKTEADHLYKRLFLINQSFNRRLSGSYRVNPDFSINNYVKRIPKIRERLAGVEIYHADASELLEKYNTKDTFAFLDPPYPEDWVPAFGVNEFDLPSFVQILKRFKGKFLLTLNDTTENKKILKDFQIHVVAYPRTAIRGPEIGEDTEIIVSNYLIRIPAQWKEYDVEELENAQKMELDKITPESLHKVSQEELLNLHLRCHQLYNHWF